MIADGDFWSRVDELFLANRIVIDRPSGSAHPKYPDMIYPLDYGYLDETVGGDGAGIDVWLGGSPQDPRVVGFIATVDVLKRDMELKLLVDCSQKDVANAASFLRKNGLGVVVVLRDRSSR